MALEKQYRLHEASRVTGYAVAALRKKIARRELAYRKTGRIVTIPESELARLLGDLRPAIHLHSDPSRVRGRQCPPIKHRQQSEEDILPDDAA